MNITINHTIEGVLKRESGNEVSATVTAISYYGDTILAVSLLAASSVIDSFRAGLSMNNRRFTYTKIVNGRLQTWDRKFFNSQGWQYKTFKKPVPSLGLTNAIMVNTILTEDTEDTEELLWKAIVVDDIRSRPNEIMERVAKNLDVGIQPSWYNWLAMQGDQQQLLKRAHGSIPAVVYRTDQERWLKIIQGGLKHNHITID